ncbi:unnamed protein product [Prorocentrum cordatum]|uniref:Non-structural maintenance of chromosomes element 4 n=1 Tax=Prorocentrum cordatum TaxID=2364126 RepID=A0ABN9W768_9DINO|nr:unnamed protein product [Polarella glacialis]
MPEGEAAGNGAAAGSGGQLPPWFSGHIATVNKRAGEGSAPDERAPKHGRQQGQVQAKDKDRLVVAIGQLQLANSRELADVAANTFKRYELPVDTGLVATSIKSGQQCDEISRDLKEKAKAGENAYWRGRGPPRLHVFTGARLCGAEMTPSAGATQEQEKKLKQAFEQVRVEKLMTMTPQELTRAALYFRVKVHKKPSDGGKHKCTMFFNFDLSTDFGKVAAPLMGALIQLEGGVFLSGAAPRGPLEREIATLLAARK